MSASTVGPRLSRVVPLLGLALIVPALAWVVWQDGLSRILDAVALGVVLYALIVAVVSDRARVLAALIGTPLSLPEELLARFPELRAARYRRGGIFVRIGGWCLGIRSVAGITLGRTIWLAPHARLDVALLLHEIRHVQQFATIWWFPLRYVWESLRRGYLANRFEVDADAYVRRRRLTGSAFE